MARKTLFPCGRIGQEIPPPSFGVHQASYPVGTGYLQGQSSWGVTLTTHFRLVLKLRLSVAVPLFSLRAFTARTATLAVA